MPLNSSVKLPVSNNPYQSPQSDISDALPLERRWAHVIVAFLSAIFMPAGLAYGVLLLWSSDYHVVVKPEAIGTIVFGAFISAAAVYRHKRIPLWAAALVGILVVLLLTFAPLIWAALLGRSTA